MTLWDPHQFVREQLPGLRLPETKDLSVWSDTHSRDSLLWERDSIRALLPPGLRGREDLAWYRRVAIEGFCFFYDHSTYDRIGGKYTLDTFLDDAEREFGGFDSIILWQPYPRIGVDQRNQFDFWRDMPGGLDGVKEAVAQAHARGVRCLLNYLPWDGHTRPEGQDDAEMMAELLRATEADGLYGDTMWGFPREFAEALERVGPGLVLESERLATPEQVTWQAGSWVQNPRPDPHLVPFVRWLQPEHAIVATNRHQSDRSRLISWSFLFGIGHVVWENVFGWWSPYQEADRALLRRLGPLLREHADAFSDPGWTPVEGLPAGLHGNYWRAPGKLVVTLWNNTPEPRSDLPIHIDPHGLGFATDALTGQRLAMSDSKGGGLVDLEISMAAHAPACLLFTQDEVTKAAHSEATTVPPTVLRRTASREDNVPRAASPTPARSGAPAPRDMVLVPGGAFRFSPHHTWPYDEGGCYDHPGDYGNLHDVRDLEAAPLLVDRTEVTNDDFHEFLESTGYRPQELTNFLAHWVKSTEDPASWHVPDGRGDHPVVWVDLEDARAYASWAGKRLATEEEWQFAAQGVDGRTWPWGEEAPVGRCNTDSDGTTPVDSFPDGASPWGCLDMAGNVWEWTESERDDSHTRYAILKSGSFWQFPQDASSWYVASGAQPCAAHQKMLLMYPGLDRCATVGFRCVMDVDVRSS